MTLVRCKHCGAEADTNAACPKCGANPLTGKMPRQVRPKSPPTYRHPIDVEATLWQRGQTRVGGKCRRCGVPVDPTAARCPACGADSRTGKDSVMGEEIAPLLGEKARPSETNPVRELVKFACFGCIVAAVLLLTGTALVLRHLAAHRD
jgi:RNA polymerase subunit RPABC4/transcription elongation factor Spt4